MDWSVPIGGVALPVRLDGDGQGDLYVLAHSAGGRMDDPLRGRLADAMAGAGFGVIRFNFPYRVESRGVPDRMPRLVESYRAVLASVRERLAPARLFVGGHSMGGRAASMMAAEGVDAAGLILLGYPLHPAGQPEKRRDAHLPAIANPVLCLNGTRDDLCLTELMESVLQKLPTTFTMHWLKDADHSFGVLKSSARSHAQVLEEIGSVSRSWADAAALASRPSAPTP